MRQQHSDHCDYMLGADNHQMIQFLLLLFNVVIMSAMCIVRDCWQGVVVLAGVHITGLHYGLRSCVPESKTVQANFNLVKMFRAMLIRSWSFLCTSLVSSIVCLAFGHWTGKTFAFSTILGTASFVVYFESKTMGYVTINTTKCQKGSWGYRMSNVESLAVWYLGSIVQILYP